MEYVRFGTTDFNVSRMGLGCMSMSGAYGPADEAESIATLHRAFDLGVNFLDTSASYGNGHNHELIRKALEGRRERIVIHSKSGSMRTDDGRTLGGGSPEYLTMVCDRSLQSLGLETLDIFCLSRVDPNIPIEESVGAMARLIEQGKTRYIALSEADPESIRRANGIHSVVSLQMHYSLAEREAEANIAACREFGMGFMAFSVLAQGYLAGLFREASDLPKGDRRRAFSRFDPSRVERHARLRSQVEAIARDRSATPAQIALAWAMAQGSDIIPIPGCKTVAHLEDDLEAADIELTGAELASLDGR
jgi:aryl-alcohol dehydrogenase-like predicted oxidoreductase